MRSCEYCAFSNADDASACVLCGAELREEEIIEISSSEDEREKVETDLKGKSGDLKDEVLKAGEKRPRMDTESDGNLPMGSPEVADGRRVLYTRLDTLEPLDASRDRQVEGLYDLRTLFSRKMSVFGPLELLQRKDVEDVEAVLVTSFGFSEDYLKVLENCLPGGVPITVVDSCKDGERTVTRAVTERMLLVQRLMPGKYQSMHAKLILIRFRAVAGSSAGALRVVVCSGNFMPIDHRSLLNVAWVQDFKFLDGAMVRPEDWRPQEPPKERPESPLMGDFGPMLAITLQQLHVPEGRVEDLIRGADFSTAQADLVLSTNMRLHVVKGIAGANHDRNWLQAGTTSNLAKPIAPLYSTAFGLGRLTSIRARHRAWLETPPKTTIADLTHTIGLSSSIGRLADSDLPLRVTLAANGVFPSAVAEICGYPSHRITNESSVPTNSLPLTIHWPAESGALASQTLPGAAHMFFQASEWMNPSCPRNIFAPQSPFRASEISRGVYRDRFVLSHSKMLSFAPTSSPKDEWVYVGSANFSNSAWGRVNVYKAYMAIQGSNIELGVVLPPKKQSNPSTSSSSKRPKPESTSSQLPYWGVWPFNDSPDALTPFRPDRDPIGPVTNPDSTQIPWTQVVDPSLSKTAAQLRLARWVARTKPSPGTPLLQRPRAYNDNSSNPLLPWIQSSMSRDY